MTDLLRKIPSHPDDPQKIAALEKEIGALEKDLAKAENEVNVFSARLRAALMPQILRIQELTVLYKKVQAAKKARRLEQKKKGKNYRPPVALKTQPNLPVSGNKVLPQNQDELKKLYKEAIRHVHPDKFAAESAEKTERATAITSQLNEFYESGDLEEMQGFYEYIISGNAMQHQPYQPATIADAPSLLRFLEKKKTELTKALQDLHNSELYHVLQTYTEPLSFIPELQLQFEQKIRQLEKRTRKATKL